MSRTARGVLIAALLVPMVALVPSLWFWVSTVPEESPVPAPAVARRPSGGLLDLDPARVELRLYPLGEWLPASVERVRILRWGVARGMRHGRYLCFDDEGRLRIEGEYDRGRLAGAWTVWEESGAIRVHGRFDDTFERHGRWTDVLAGAPAEIEYRHGKVVRWRLGREENFLRWIVPPADDLSLFDNGTIQLGRWLPSSDPTRPRWVRDGTAMSVGVAGRVEAIGPYVDGRKHGLWTYFHEDGEVEQQDIYEDGLIRLSRQRTSAPWYDLTPCFDPRVPIGPLPEPARTVREGAGKGISPSPPAVAD